MVNKLASLTFLIMFMSGCSTSTKEVINKPEIQPQVSKTITTIPAKGLRRKVAIARFSNETKHGNSFLLDKNNDRIGKQAMDILSTRLTDTGKFLMFERADLSKIKAEQDIAKINSQLVGADYLIVGSVSEFGRTTTSEVGLFSRNKKQKANATVNVRLIDVTTGQIVFSQEGSGEALSEANRVFGVGARAGYDSKLDDDALSAAISKLVSNLIENLLDKPWVAYILDFTDGQIILSGGKSQGIKVGDEFSVIQRGKQVKNPQTGLLIELPGREVGRVEVISFAGIGNNEVSICSVISGDLRKIKLSELIVRESRG
ncbi:MAG: curli production assembly protein CsgG [Gammaproteobacteria bacterium]|nr:curli production assembly protein CsgG [Gammaproteobacteria bacterium]MBT6835946.1 curli production assembly protein CsgG [Bacteroidota bacterium]